MEPETLNATAALLGVFLTAIAAFFSYRAMERRQELHLARAGHVGTLSGVAGAVASTQNIKLYVEEFQKLTHSIDHLAKAQYETAEAAKESSRLWRQGLKEFEEIRRSIEDLAHSARNMRAVQQAMQDRLDRQNRGE